MNLPRQAAPVLRHASPARYNAERVAASQSLDCQVCCASCMGPPPWVCKAVWAACEKFIPGCKCN
jgi:hypothetical protein